MPALVLRRCLNILAKVLSKISVNIFFKLRKAVMNNMTAYSKYLIQINVLVELQFPVDQPGYGLQYYRIGLHQLIQNYNGRTILIAL